MATLSFKCLHETNEDSPSDSPYFLVYVGDRSNKRSDVRRVKKSIWDDAVDAGEPARTATGIKFSPLVKNFDVVLVALIEEDWDADINLEKKVRETMNNFDHSLESLSISDLRLKLINAIEASLVNDDLVNVQKFSNNAWHFLSGDEAIYHAKFAF